MDEFIKHLQESYHPQTEVVGVIWQKEDIIWRAEDRGLSISDEKAVQIVDALGHGHDACIGINWEVIDFHLDDLG